MSSKSRLAGAVTICLVAGLGLGVALRTQSPSGAGAVALQGLDLLGGLWVNAIRVTVIPLIVPLMIAAVAGAADPRRLGALGGRAIALFVGLLSVVAVATALATPGVIDALKLDSAAVAALRATTSHGGPALAEPGLTGWILGLIPANIFKAAADGAPLPLLLFAVAVGMAAASGPEALRERVTTFAAVMRDVMLILVRWVLAIAPLGVFALGATFGARLGAQAFGALIYYVVIASAGAILVTLALYPVASLFGGVGLARFARAVAPAQVIAGGTRSSLAALPAMLHACRDRLDLSPEAVDFVLPLAVSTFKLAIPVFWLTSTFLVARLFGVHLGVGQIALVAAASVLLNATVPGIPNGGAIALAPVFAMIGLPVEGLAVVIALESIPDIFFTIANVTGDMTVAVVVGRRQPSRPT